MDSKNAKLLPCNYVPQENDVICGRGSDCFYHVGNVKFRELVKQNVDRYSKALTKNQRTDLIHEVIEVIQSRYPNGAFVKKNLEDGRYYEVTEFLAREKVSSAFRDALKDQTKSKSFLRLGNRDSVRKGNNSFMESSFSNTSIVEGSVDSNFSNSSDFHHEVNSCFRNNSFPSYALPIANSNFAFTLSSVPSISLSYNPPDQFNTANMSVQLNIQSPTTSSMDQSTHYEENIKTHERSSSRSIQFHKAPDRLNDVYINPDWIRELHESEDYDIDSLFETESPSDTNGESMLLSFFDNETLLPSETIEYSNHDPWECYLDNLQETETDFMLEPHQIISVAARSDHTVSSIKSILQQANSKNDDLTASAPVVENLCNPLTTTGANTFSLLHSQIQPFNCSDNGLDMSEPDQHYQYQQSAQVVLVKSEFRRQQNSSNAEEVEMRGIPGFTNHYRDQSSKQVASESAFSWYKNPNK